MKWTKKNEQKWHKWFAWYPVTVNVDGQDYKLQWYLWDDDSISSGITWESVIRHLEMKYDNDTGV